MSGGPALPPGLDRIGARCVDSVSGRIPSPLMEVIVSRTFRGGHSRTSKRLSDRQRSKRFGETVKKVKGKRRAKRSPDQIAFDALEDETK